MTNAGVEPPTPVDDDEVPSLSKATACWITETLPSTVFSIRIQMEQRRLRTLVAVGMVLLGSVQAVWGLVRGDLPFASFGVVYAIIGGASYWFTARPGT